MTAFDRRYNPGSQAGCHILAIQGHTPHMNMQSSKHVSVESVEYVSMKSAEYVSMENAKHLSVESV